MNKPEHTLDEFYLKPCPFCGGDAIIRPIKSGYRIRCTACHIERNKKVLRMPLEWLHGEMIKDWNERQEAAELTSLREENKRLREALEIIHDHVFKSKEYIMNSPVPHPSSHKAPYRYALTAAIAKAEQHNKPDDSIPEDYYIKSDE